jgi:hypothetical protein
MKEALEIILGTIVSFGVFQWAQESPLIQSIFSVIN